MRVISMRGCIAGLVALLFTSAAARAEHELAGAAEIELALRKLNVLGSVLMIGAHPDDENTALLAYFARGRHARTAYLSATRGEGGQNLIGPEQGDLLGVIRTQELLAARKMDGAEQFFTRAIDFGFSKTAVETLAQWDREKILGDMVWVIRRYRPDIVVLRFSGTPRDGHGHHQSSAILGKEAFSAAADRNRFPEHLKRVEAWQAKRLLFNVFTFSAAQEKEAAGMPQRLEIDSGEYNPVLGRSYNEIAGISRSMHRSQGMGAAQRRGSSKNYLVTIAGDPATQDVFDGVDITWNRFPGGAAIAPILADAARSFSPEHPEKIIPLLLKARPLLTKIRDPWAEQKQRELDEILALCSGLWLDATSERAEAIPGSELKINLTALDRSSYPLTVSGITVAGQSIPGTPVALAYNQPKSFQMSWRVPQTQPYSQPFWLERPKQGSTYTIENQERIGVADALPVLEARFQLIAGTEKLELVRPVRFRYIDHVEGELTRPLAVIPPVALRVPEAVMVFPAARARQVEVLARINTAATSGDIRLKLPEGWKSSPEKQAFRSSEAGEQMSVSFEITPGPEAGSGVARAVAETGGREVSSEMLMLSYPHIPPQTVFRRPESKLIRIDVKNLAHNVGYIMGAGDEVPDSLRQLGCQVTLLGPEDLARRDLGTFDAIVTGVRAYNVRADLRANQHRLLDYMRNGGALIVQYNVAPGMGGPVVQRDASELSRIGPYPLRVGRDRVTVEDVPVNFPQPGHFLLKTPNVIGEQDFAGWIQERGLYFASEWDAQYQPVLESHDPGEKPLPGGMLYAPYGKGAYVFTAYAWFRQLPAGVPGAYRIFANLLSAAKTRPQ